VVLEKITAPASRSRAAGRPKRHRLALGGDIVLDGDRNAVERADRFTHLPAVGRGFCDRARALGIAQIERLDMWLPYRDMRNDLFQHFRRRELLGAVACDQVDGREIVE
jgi:hypothetical protein